MHKIAGSLHNYAFSTAYTNTIEISLSMFTEDSSGVLCPKIGTKSNVTIERINSADVPCHEIKCVSCNQF